MVHYIIFWGVAFARMGTNLHCEFTISDIVYNYGGVLSGFRVFVGDRDEDGIIFTCTNSLILGS